MVFENNTTKNCGGAIYLQANSAAKISGKKVVFKNNTAKKFGGAIYVQYSSLTVDGATFERNSASLGGAILALGGSVPEKKATVQLKDCTFTGNSTTDSRTTVQESSNSLSGNTADAFWGKGFTMTITASKTTTTAAKMGIEILFFISLSPFYSC